MFPRAGVASLARSFSKCSVLAAESLQKGNQSRRNTSFIF